MLIQLLPGLAFLTGASMMVAVPFAMLIKSKPRAALLTVTISTLVLKLGACFAINGFEAEFLPYLLSAGPFAAISVNMITAFIGKCLLKPV
jgi:hypothetical protein